MIARRLSSGWQYHEGRTELGVEQKITRGCFVHKGDTWFQVKSYHKESAQMMVRKTPIDSTDKQNEYCAEDQVQ
jgi:hypothetical protein